MVARTSDLEISPASLSAIKILDIKTRRYYAGLVRAASDGSLEVELPAAAVLFAGGIVRYALSESAFIPAHKMQSAVVTQMARVGRCLRVSLAFEMAFATA